MEGIYLRKQQYCNRGKWTVYLVCLLRYELKNRRISLDSLQEQEIVSYFLLQTYSVPRPDTQPPYPVKKLLFLLNNHLYLCAI